MLEIRYSSDAIKEAFITWYNLSDYRTIKGEKVAPEDNSDIEAIVKYFNDTVADNGKVEVING